MSFTGSRSEQQLVVFTLAGESYGVDIAKVSGIERMQEITRVPRTPPYVEGVINLRGRVIPVIHLRKLFSLDEGEITKETRIVVVDIGGQPIGVQVDEVTQVLTIASETIEPPSAVIASADADYLLGIAKLKDKMIILLDLDKLLTQRQASQMAEFHAAQAKARKAAQTEGETPEANEPQPDAAKVLGTPKGGKTARPKEAVTH